MKASFPQVQIALREKAHRKNTYSLCSICCTNAIPHLTTYHDSKTTKDNKHALWLSPSVSNCLNIQIAFNRTQKVPCIKL